MSEIREEVMVFAKEMERKLKKNDYKGGWKDHSKATLWNLMKDEVKEFDEALINGNKEHIFSEAVDIANFLMMLVDNIGALSKSINIDNLGKKE